MEDTSEGERVQGPAAGCAKDREDHEAICSVNWVDVTEYRGLYIHSAAPTRVDMFTLGPRGTPKTTTFHTIHLPAKLQSTTSLTGALAAHSLGCCESIGTTACSQCFADARRSVHFHLEAPRSPQRSAQLIQKRNRLPS